MSRGHDPHSHPQQADSEDEPYGHEQLMAAGARLVTRYWTDPDFAQRVHADSGRH